MSSKVAAAAALFLWSMTNAVRAEEPTAEQLVETAREAYMPSRGCKPATDGTIVVCGNDTQQNRLSPELRNIAGVGRSTRDSIPPAPEAKAMSLDRLPYNWMGRDGVLFPRAKPNPLLDHVKAMEAARAADAAAEADRDNDTSAADQANTSAVVP